jgi:DNA-binding CsgD family transcriptional regulator/Tfp pilus assembly protein PilE
LYLYFIFKIKDIRAQTFAYTPHFITLYLFVFCTNLTMRGILGVMDRGTLTFYIALEFLISLLLVVPLRQRLLLLGLPAACVLVFMVFGQAHLPIAHLVARYLEVIIVAVLSFSLASIQYNNSVERFSDQQAILAQTQKLNEQHHILQQQNTDLETLNTQQQTLNEQLVAQQTLLNAQAVVRETEQHRLRSQTEQQSRQLTTFALQMTENNHILDEIALQLTELQATLSKPQQTQLRKITRFIATKKSTGEDWERFKIFFEQTHPQFFTYLNRQYPDLSNHDYRLLALLSLQLSSKDIAALLAISVTSVNTARYRLRRRLNLPNDIDLLSFSAQLPHLAKMGNGILFCEAG